MYCKDKHNLQTSQQNQVKKMLFGLKFHDSCILFQVFFVNLQVE